MTVTRRDVKALSCPNAQREAEKCAQGIRSLGHICIYLFKGTLYVIVQLKLDTEKLAV